MTAHDAKATGNATPTQLWGTLGTTGVSFAAGLTFEQVTVRLGERLVLDALDLAVTPGEIVCLLGESGSGKSTALRVAAGILPVDGGRVLINQTPVSTPTLHVPPDRRGIGMMFQDFALFPHMTVLENVLFGLRGLDRAAADAQARVALKRVGLDSRCNDFPHMLSGGQQQRLALARSVAPRPGILMLDEPFSSLDARLRETVRTETLAVLRETYATCVIVTHDPEEAMLMGDRIALLRQGKIVQIDNAEQFYHQPVDIEAARFLSALSEVRTSVHEGQADTPFGPVAAPGFAEGDKVIVALRPVGAFDMNPQGPGTPGRIVGKRHTLGVEIYEVSVAGMDRPVRVRQRADETFVPGTDIFLTLRPGHVLVFAAD